MNFFDFLRGMATNPGATLDQAASGQYQSPFGATGDAIAQRAAQEGAALFHGTGNLPIPGMRGPVDYGDVPLIGLPLRAAFGLNDLAGLTSEGIGNAQHVAQGAAIAGLGALTNDPTVSNNPATQNTLDRAALAFQQAPGNFFTKALAAQQVEQREHPTQALLLDLATNPLAGPTKLGNIGEALQGLSRGAPGTAALADALSGAERAGNLPFQADPLLHPLRSFQQLRDVLGAPGAAGDAGTAFASAFNAVPEADALTQSAARPVPPPAPQTPPGAPEGLSAAQTSALGQLGIDPARVAGLHPDAVDFLIGARPQPADAQGLIAALGGATPGPAVENAGLHADPFVEAVNAANRAQRATPPAVPDALSQALDAAPPPAAPTGPLLDVARQDYIDSIMSSPRAASGMLDLLHAANYPSGSSFPLKAVYGQSRVPPELLGQHLDWQLQRVLEDPKALQRLSDANPQVADFVGGALGASDQSAVELQNALRAAAGRPPKVGTAVQDATSAAQAGTPTAAADVAPVAAQGATAAPEAAGRWTPEQLAIFANDPGVQQIEQSIATIKNAGPGMDNGGIGIASDRGKALRGLSFRLSAARQQALKNAATTASLPQEAASVAPVAAESATAALPPPPPDQDAAYQAVKDLVLSHDNGKTIGVVSDPAYYAKRLGIAPADATAALGRMEYEGLIGEAYRGGGLEVVPPAKAGGGLADAAGGYLPIGGAVGLARAALPFAGYGIGSQIGDTPEERQRNALLGAGVGGLGALGSGPVGMALAKEGLAGQQAAMNQPLRLTPSSAQDAVAEMRQFAKTGLRTIPRNILGNIITTAVRGGDLPTAVRYTKAIFDALPQTLPALRAATNDAQRQQILFDSMPADVQQYGANGIGKLLTEGGAGYDRDPTDAGAGNIHPLTGALHGLGLGLVNPRMAVIGLPSLALSAAEGATLAGRTAIQNAALRPIDQGPRLAFSFQPYTNALAAAAPDFLQRLTTAGVDTTGLDARGTFDPTDIAPGVKVGANAAVDAAREQWDAIQSTAASTAGKVARDNLGDYKTQNGALRLLNSIFPGATWNVRQAQVLAGAMVKNPIAALSLLGAAEADYQQHLKAGDPEHAGEIVFNDQTPGVGMLARVLNGGAAGQASFNPGYPGSPVGSSILDLGRQLDVLRNPGMKVTDKALKITDALGLAPNPLGLMGLYALGATTQAPTSPIREMPIAAYADAKQAAQGGPLIPNPIGGTLATLHALTTQGAAAAGDTGQQIVAGRYVNPTVEDALGEIVYEKTGKTLADPSNIQAVRDAANPRSALYQQAVERALGGAAAKAAVNALAPASIQATTTTAASAQRATEQLRQAGIPTTLAQFQLLSALQGPDAAAAAQAQLDALKARHPLLALHDAASPGERAQLLLNDWVQQNPGMRMAPGLFQMALAQEQERLGLQPLGTLAQQQHAADLVALGQRYGQPGQLMETTPAALYGLNLTPSLIPLPSVGDQLARR